MRRIVALLLIVLGAGKVCAQVSLSATQLTWEANETDTKYVTVSSFGGNGRWECDSTVYSNHFVVSPQSGSSGGTVAITPMSTVTGDAIDGGIAFVNPNTGAWASLDLLHKGPSGTFSVSPLSLSWAYNETQSKTVTVTGDGWSSSVSYGGFTRVENTTAGTITVTPAGSNTGSTSCNANLVVYQGNSEKYVWLTQAANSSGGGNNNGGNPSNGAISISPSSTIRWSAYETSAKFVTVSSTSGAWRKDTCSLGPHFSMSPTLGPSGELAWFTPSGINETLADIEDAVFIETQYGQGGAQITLIHEHDPYLLKPSSDSLVWTADQTGWQGVSVLTAIGWTARIAGGGFTLETESGTGSGTVRIHPSGVNPTTSDIVAWLELSAPGARTRSVKLIQRGRSTPVVIPDTFTGTPGMRIPVSRSVTPTGAVTYSVPVFTDPSAKLSHGIGLVYSSQSGNGVAGYGWHVSGLSSITLIPKTRYYHGKNKAADVNGSDHAYALDGVPLMESEEYAAGTTGYPLKTVRGNIRVKKTLSGFEALYPDGRKAVFGEGPATGGNTRLVYPVTSIEDALGNVVTFSYLTDHGTCYPETIAYNTALACPDTIMFSYAARSDYVPAYSAGVEVSVRRLLKTITSSVNGEPVRTYTLTHGTQYGVSCLLELGCSTGTGSSQETLEPVRFEYGGGAAMPEEFLSSTLSDVVLPSLPNLTGSGSKYITSRGKFFPNSYEDGLLAYPAYSNYHEMYSDKHGHKQYRSEYPSSTTLLLVPDLTVAEEPLTVTTAGDGFQDAQVLDVDNDGLDDIVKVNILAESSTQKSRLLIKTYRLNETDGEVQQKAELPVVRVNGYIEDGGLVNAQQRCYRYGCLTQDGHAQLITTGYDTDIAGRTATSYTAVIDLVSGSLLAEEPLFTVTPSNEPCHFVADLDGDGISEVCMIDDSRLAVYGFRSDGSFGNLSYHYGIKASDVSDGYRIADLNGDGMLDIVCVSTTSDEWKVFHYTGSSFIMSYCSAGAADSDTRMLFVDLDRDGVQDLVRADSDGKIRYRMNNGGVMNGEEVATTQTVSSNTIILPAGILDCRGVARFATVDGGNIRYYSFNIDKRSGRVITTARDSFHNHWKNTYKDISQPGSGYGNDHGTLAMGANYTERVFPLMVCDSTEVVSGGRLVERIRRDYHDAAVSTLGIGFICFSSLHVRNLIGGVYTETVNDPAVLGMPVEEKVYSVSGWNQKTLTLQSGRIINPVLNAYGNAVDGRVLTSFAQDELTGVSSGSNCVYDTLGFPISVSVSRRIGNGTPVTEVKVVEYSHSLADSLYVLGPVIKKEIIKGTLDGKTEYILDGKKRPTRTMEYAGTVNGADTTWCLSSDRDITYDAKGNITTDRSAAYGATTYNETAYAYDAAGRYLSGSTDPLGRTTSYSYYNKYGKPAQTTDWLGRRVSYVYDAWGNATQKTNADGTVETTSVAWSFQGEPGLYCVTKTVTGQPSTKVWYDALGREVRNANQRFDGSWQYVTMEYDGRGRLYRTSLPYKDTVTGPTLWNTYTYDAYDRPTNLAEATGKQTTWSYSGTSTTTVKEGMQSTSTTDAEGNVVSVVDGGGTITYTLRDDGQPSAVTVCPQDTCQNIVTTFQYDIFGRRTSMADPSAGTRGDTYTDNTDGSSSVAHTGPNGTVTTYYDRYGRVTGVTRPEFNTTYTYGTTLNSSSYGKLISESSTNGTGRAYTYDALGRTATETEHADSTHWLKKTYTYNATGANLGSLASIAYSTQDGDVTTESFSYANGHNTGIAASGPGNTSINVFTLTSENALGQPTLVTTGGVSRTYGYTASGLPSRRRILNGQNSVIQDFEYSYEVPTGNMAWRKDNVLGMTESFDYDGLNRLTDAGQTLPEPMDSLDWRPYARGVITAGYNSKGNVESLRGLSMSYDNPADPYQNTSATITDGEWVEDRYAALSMGTTSFDRPDYLREDPLWSEEPVYYAQYRYNAEGEKVKGSFPVIGMERSYLGGVYEKDTRSYEVWSEDLMEMIPLTETIQRLFLGGTAYDAPMVYVKIDDGAWTPYNIGRDVQGSITHVATQGGTPLETYYYDPWGNVVPMSSEYNSIDTLAVSATGGSSIYSKIIGSHGYTGHESIAGIGMYNANARLYDPATGRFLSPDPLIQDPGFTQNFNRYSYCLNNPLKYTDESGEYIGWDDFAAAMLGGTINWISHGCDFSWQGLAYFSAGMLGGIASLYVDPLASIWLTDALNSTISQGFSEDGNTWTGDINPITVAYDAMVGALIAKTGGEVTSTVSSWIGDFSDVVPGKAWASMLNRSLSNGAVALGVNAIQAYSASYDNPDLAYWEAFANGLPGVAESMAYGAIAGIGEGIQQANALGENPWTGKEHINSFSPDVTAKDLGLQDTMDRIQKGIPDPHRRDGHTYHNGNHRLPLEEDGYYKEYVHRIPGASMGNAGLHRIVIGGNNEVFYYSPDHYETFILFKP